MSDQRRTERTQTDQSRRASAMKGKNGGKLKTGKSKTGKPNTDKPNTDKHGTSKPNTNKPKTGKHGTGKWITVPATETPAAEVAYKALSLRLAHVQRMLPLAAYQHAENLEHVHRLRVGCRRAAAALSAFRPLIGGKVKPLRRWLQRLRDAAGPAREVDVLLMELEKDVAAGVSRLQYMVDSFQSRREKVQRRLVRVAERAQVDSPQGRLQQAITKCLNSIPADKRTSGKPFGPFATAGLTTSADAMLHLGEELLPAGNSEFLPDRLPSIERLHALRIAAKRFRYSIELFHSAFPASLRNTIYIQIENMQQRLGLLNDHATMQQQFQWLMATSIPEDRVVDLAARIVQQYEAVLDARLAFMQWWTPERTGMLRMELDQLLSNHNGSKNG